MGPGRNDTAPAGGGTEGGDRSHRAPRVGHGKDEPSRPWRGPPRGAGRRNAVQASHTAEAVPSRGPATLSPAKGEGECLGKRPRAEQGEGDEKGSGRGLTCAATAARTTAPAPVAKEEPCLS